jgi:hypothetical protein
MLHRRASRGTPGQGARDMSKSQDTKKEDKKKSAKTMKEKRADKKAKRDAK